MVSSKHLLSAIAAAVLSTTAAASSYVYRQPASGIQPVAAPVAPPAPPPAALACVTPWGASLASGQSIPAYQTASVGFGDTCATESRACSDGVLSGSYAYSACTQAAPADCTTPWGTAVSHGASVTAYLASSVTGSTACSPQQRSCSNGVLSGTYANQACTVNPSGITLTSGVHQWADGTSATSCAAYRNPTAGYSYTGSTGDGLYLVKLNGTDTPVYCDMANGGWTLVAKGTADVNVAGWYAATGNYSVPAAPSPSTSATWKYGDAAINAIPKSSYRVTVTGGYPGTYYISGSCTYGHQTQATGACAKLYSSEAMTTPVGNTAANANGIANNQGTSYQLVLNNTAANASIGWCAGNGSPGQGGCGAAGTRVSLTMWVK